MTPTSKIWIIFTHSEPATPLQSVSTGDERLAAHLSQRSSPANCTWVPPYICCIRVIECQKFTLRIPQDSSRLGEFRQNQHCREGECVHGAAARRGSSSARRCRRSDGGGRRRSVPAPSVCTEALRPTLRRGAKTTGACCCEVRLVQQYNQRHSEDKIEVPTRSLRPGPGPALESRLKPSSLHTMISLYYDTSTMADDNPALGSQGGAISVRISLNRRTD